MLRASYADVAEVADKGVFRVVARAVICALCVEIAVKSYTPPIPPSS